MSKTDDDSSNEQDRLYETLQHRVRRAVLLTLRRRDERLSVQTLAEDIALETADEQSTSVVLHHIHLPKLAEAGLITYDRSSQTVELSENSLPEQTWPPSPSER